jgi:peptidoglycan/LPS O-acetylase OafA/YrhL
MPGSLETICSERSSSVPFASTTASVLLDALRGVAAFLVLIEHWRNAFFVDFMNIHQLRGVMAPLYVLSGAGHQAVIVFFVLSGYLITGTVMRSIQRNTWSWARYFLHRLIRLWIVLIPALVMGLGWDLLGIYLGRSPGLYTGTVGNHMVQLPIASSLNATAFFGNLAFVQTILVPPLGTNGALWSLANEWWYYMLFPLAACVVGRVYRNFVAAALSLAGFGLLAFFVGKAILFLFPVWLLGSLVCLIPRPKRSWSGPALSCVGVLYALLFFSLSTLEHRGDHIGLLHFSSLASDTFLGIATAAFLWLLLSRSEPTKAGLPVRFARESARFSYTLYVAHLPILMFCVSLLAGDARWIPMPTTIVPALAVLFFVIGYAWLIAYATEFRTEPVRRWLETKLLRDASR